MKQGFGVSLSNVENRDKDEKPSQETFKARQRLQPSQTGQEAERNVHDDAEHRTETFCFRISNHFNAFLSLFLHFPLFSQHPPQPQDETAGWWLRGDTGTGNMRQKSGDLLFVTRDQLSHRIQDKPRTKHKSWKYVDTNQHQRVCGSAGPSSVCRRGGRSSRPGQSCELCSVSLSAPGCSIPLRRLRIVAEAEFRCQIKILTDVFGERLTGPYPRC